MHYRLGLLLQQTQDVLLGGISLCQHRSCGLVEDLQLSQLRSLKCKVRIPNTASRRRQIGEMLVRLFTVWLKRLDTAPSSERWTFTVVIAASILAVAARELPPDASDMAVVAGVALDEGRLPTYDPVVIEEIRARCNADG